MNFGEHIQSEFINQFSNLLHTYENANINANHKECQRIREFTVKTLKMIDAYPFYVIENIHPEWIRQKLESFNNCCRSKLLKSIAEYDSVKVRNIVKSFQFKTTGTCIRNCCHNSTLTKLIDGWPIMTSRTRFSNSSWKQLPFMKWERIEYLVQCLKKKYPGTSLAELYYCEWNQMRQSDKNTALIWLEHKLMPDQGRLFVEQIKSMPHIKNRTNNYCDSILQKVMVGGFKK